MLYIIHTRSSCTSCIIILLSSQDIYPFNTRRSLRNSVSFHLFDLSSIYFTPWKELNDSISIYIFIIEAIPLYVTRAILHSLHSLVPRRILAFFNESSLFLDISTSSHPSPVDPPPI